MLAHGLRSSRLNGSILRRMMKSASGWQSRTLRTTSMIHIQDNKLWQELLYSKIKIKEA